MDDVIPDRIIEEKERATFNFTSLVAINTVDRPAFIVNNPVNVYSDDGRLIGSVSLEKDGRWIYGKFYIDYSSPERLNMQIDETLMYAHINYNDNQEIESVTLSSDFVKNGILGYGI